MRPSAYVLVAILLCFSAFFVFLGLHSVYGLGIFSKDEKPFGKSYDEWAAEYWSKYLAKNTAQATPQPGGCLIVNNDYKSAPAIMLMPPFDVGFHQMPTQACQISSNQGVLVPLWAEWADHDTLGSCQVSNLPQCARLENLGNIASDMKVDGTPVAKLNVRLSMTHLSGSLDYKINSLINATQSTSKVFPLTLPPDSVEIANNVPGTWQAASDGWWVFLKPLPPGQHSISYSARVTRTGPTTSPGTSPHFADITYKLQVVK